MRLLSAAPAIGLFVVVALAPARSMPSNCPGIADCAPLEVVDARVSDRRSDAEALLRDLNAKRAERGLSPLVEDARLDRVARDHAVDMVDHRYFGHTSLDGRSPFARMSEAGIAYGYAGENIAHNVDAETTNEALWASAPHRANRLQRRFTRVGIVALVTHGAGELIVEDYTD